MSVLARRTRKCNVYGKHFGIKVGGTGLTPASRPATRRVKRTRSNGRTVNRNTVFHFNQVGGVGAKGARNSRMFASKAGGVTR